MMSEATSEAVSEATAQAASEATEQVTEQPSDGRVKKIATQVCHDITESSYGQNFLMQPISYPTVCSAL